MLYSSAAHLVLLAFQLAIFILIPNFNGTTYSDTVIGILSLLLITINVIFMFVVVIRKEHNISVAVLVMLKIFLIYLITREFGLFLNFVPIFLLDLLLIFRSSALYLLSVFAFYFCMLIKHDMLVLSNFICSANNDFDATLLKFLNAGLYTFDKEAFIQGAANLIFIGCVTYLFKNSYLDSVEIKSEFAKKGEQLKALEIANAELKNELDEFNKKYLNFIDTFKKMEIRPIKSILNILQERFNTEFVFIHEIGVNKISFLESAAKTGSLLEKDIYVYDEGFKLYGEVLNGNENISIFKDRYAIFKLTLDKKLDTVLIFNIGIGASNFLTVTVVLSTVMNEFITDSQLRETVTMLKNMYVEGFKNNIKISQELKKSNELMRDRFKDHLVKLYNRQMLMKYEKEIYQTGNKVVYFVMLDIDNFKTVNDLYGHAIGDSVLIKLGEILQSVQSEGKYPFRYGGDEFLLLIETDIFETKGIDMLYVYNLVKEINGKFKETKFYTATNVMFTKSLSVGIHYARNREEPFELAKSKADEALYYSKKNGRDMISIWGKVK